MSKTKVLIVGGVAGGASAATRLRRLSETAEIILFERGEHVSFANCGLPYYIGETIKDRNKLLVATPQLLAGRFGIDVRTHSEVVYIDPKRKIVRVRSAVQGEYEESYDKLILSPGAKPIRPNWDGVNDARIYTLRNIPDMDRIKAAVDQGGIEHAVVIGGGYIGIEMAENLHERGLNVTIVEGAPHVLAPFDDDIIPWVEHSIRQAGIELLTNQKVQGLHPEADAIGLELHTGRILKAQLIILAIGVQPDTAFLADSGLARGPRGHLVVDERMQTNIADIYAVGDAVEVVNFVNGQKTAIPLAGPANKQGRIAADQIAGIDSTYDGTQGTAIIKWLDLTAACTGMNERTLKQLGMAYDVAHVHPASHATYYPGSSQLTLKVIADKQTGRILGAQAVGKDGVDKRMDVLATIIRKQGTVEDLVDLELSYAPPFSSAKDPVNMAGMVLQNAQDGLSKLVTPLEWVAAEQDPATLAGVQMVDVRTPSEHAAGHIPGSVNIPVDQLRSRLDELDTSKPVWVYCRVGYRGYTAQRILLQNGFGDVLNLTGGYLSYEAIVK